MRIDIQGDEVLQGVVIALQHSDREVRKQIRGQTKAEMTRPWLRAIGEEVNTKVEGRVIAATATVAVSDQNIRIQSAAKGRKLSGGLNPKTDYAAVEFGADRSKTTRYRRTSKNGGTHNVKRRTAVQFRPRRKSGYVFYPAAKKMIPRLASLWVQTVVKTYADIFEGKS